MDTEDLVNQIVDEMRDLKYTISNPQERFEYGSHQPWCLTSGASFDRAIEGESKHEAPPKGLKVLVSEGQGEEVWYVPSLITINGRDVLILGKDENGQMVFNLNADYIISAASAIQFTWQLPESRKAATEVFELRKKLESVESRLRASIEREAHLKHAAVQERKEAHEVIETLRAEIKQLRKDDE